MGVLKHLSLVAFSNESFCLYPLVDFEHRKRFQKFKFEKIEDFLDYEKRFSRTFHSVHLVAPVILCNVQIDMNMLIIRKSGYKVSQ